MDHRHLGVHRLKKCYEVCVVISQKRVVFCRSTYMYINIPVILFFVIRFHEIVIGNALVFTCVEDVGQEETLSKGNNHLANLTIRMVGILAMMDTIPMVSS